MTAACRKVGIGHLCGCLHAPRGYTEEVGATHSGSSATSMDASLLLALSTSTHLPSSRLY